MDFGELKEILSFHFNRRIKKSIWLNTCDKSNCNF